MPPSLIWETLITAFGVAAAILLVGGWVLLRFYRDRKQFQLLHLALERGITTLPGMIPGWLISMRQGVLALVLGLGVAASGITLASTANDIEQPPAQSTSQPAQPQFEPQFQPPLPPGPDDNLPPRPPRDQRPPRPQPNRRPPPPNPAMERWHRVQTQRLAGLIALCAGCILALLGIVRILFARLERKYAAQAAGTLLPTER